MIWLIQQLAAGSALRILLTPPLHATRLRLLRKDTNDIVDETDATSLVVYDGEPLRTLVDLDGLINGDAVYYRPFWMIDGDWSASVSVSATPAADMADISVDTLSLIRDRLELGLKDYVVRGTFRHQQNYIPVLKASPQIEQVKFPIVTVHMADTSTEVRALGEQAADDHFDVEDDEWAVGEGGLDRVMLDIIVWSRNSDERALLRQAVQNILRANGEVFDSVGIVLPQWSFKDSEDYERYEAPMYMSNGTFSALAPSGFQTSITPIRSTDAVAVNQ